MTKIHVCSSCGVAGHNKLTCQGEIIITPPAELSSARLPVIRGECEPGGEMYQRPCPYSQCRYHLSAGGQSCALDVADNGVVDGEQMGRMLGISRERIRQITQIAMRKVRAYCDVIGIDIHDIVDKQRHPLDEIRQMWAPEITFSAKEKRSINRADRRMNPSSKKWRQRATRGAFKSHAPGARR